MNIKIKGNETTRNELKKIVQNNNVLHSYLFLGKEGIGKKEIAKEIAKEILCLTKDEECNCKSCIRFDSQNHPDIKIINEESETIKINTVREMIQTVYEKPILSDKKIYIINDCDKMTKEAQNSLLKTLEEPPEYIVIFLIASNSDMILNTIKSRCTKIVFDKLKEKEIKEILNNTEFNNIKISENMYDFFDGSIGKALQILERKEQYENIEEFISKIKNSSKLDFITMNKETFTKEEINGLLEYCIVLLFNLGKKEKDIKYLNSAKIIHETKIRINSNSNFDMSIDNMLFKLWEEVNENNSGD